MSSTYVINRLRLLLMIVIVYLLTRFLGLLFLTDSKLVSFLAGYYRKNGHLHYLLTE